MCRAVPARATRGSPGAVDSDSFTASYRMNNGGRAPTLKVGRQACRLCRRVLHKECMN